MPDDRERPFELVTAPGGWPTPAEVGDDADIWLRAVGSLPGAGVWQDGPDGGRWASPAARERYDLSLHGPSAGRCPACLRAFDPRRPGGRTAAYCSRACRSASGRPGWSDRAAWVRCPGCGLGRLAPAGLTARPRPACPPEPGTAGPSACERAWARLSGRARTARCRRRRAGLDALLASLEGRRVAR
jgi:hypothetical protein